IGPKQLRKLIHDLYKQAGLLKHLDGRMYDLRVHSIRKFFKTQLLALGIQSDYVDYFMGHTIDTYHDIQSIGIEKLRAIYASAGLTIRPKTQASKVDALKEIIRAWGLNPEQLLAKNAFTEGAITINTNEELEKQQLKVLANELKLLIKQEATV
ncbi:MAG: hypothetical protein ACQCN6_12220, partial [Candidatus Bathyarchaeia archaeon]